MKKLTTARGKQALAEFLRAYEMAAFKGYWLMKQGYQEAGKRFIIERSILADDFSDEYEIDDAAYIAMKQADYRACEDARRACEEFSVRTEDDSK